MILKFVQRSLSKNNISSQRNYYIIAAKGSHQLENIKEEKDVGIVVDSKLKCESHVYEKVKTENRMTGLIKRSFQDLNKDSFLLLYNTMVRFQMEDGQTILSLYKQKHIIATKRVQKRTTRLLKGFSLLSYEERLRRLELPTLVYRRLRGDMIEVYKNIHEYYDKDDVTLHLQINPYDRSRGHNKRLYKPAMSGERRRQFFSERVLDHWNSLRRHC